MQVLAGRHRVPVPCCARARGRRLDPAPATPDLPVGSQEQLPTATRGARGRAGRPEWNWPLGRRGFRSFPVRESGHRPSRQKCLLCVIKALVTGPVYVMQHVYHTELSCSRLVKSLMRQDCLINHKYAKIDQPEASTSTSCCLVLVLDRRGGV